jgi:sugar/nucleoside kinase (ribokinase family)
MFPLGLSREREPVTARRMLLPLIGKADLVLMGHEDSMAIFGLQGESAMQAAAELGAKLVVLKVGANGALALVDGAVVSAPARSAPHPNDPVGAGDAFSDGAPRVLRAIQRRATSQEPSPRPAQRRSRTTPAADHARK